MAVENTAFFIGEFMTVSVSERLSPLYEGNGSNTRFDFTFRVFNQEDATGVSIKHQVGADFENVDENLYTVTLNEDNLGGYVTFLSAPVVGFQFYIAGETPVDQALLRDQSHLKFIPHQTVVIPKFKDTQAGLYQGLHLNFRV